MNQILKIGNITADLVTRNMYFLQIAKTYLSVPTNQHVL